MKNFQLWFSKLQKKEQHMLAGTAVFVAVTLLYLIIWEPVFESLQQETTKLQSQKKNLSWMQQAEREIQAIRTSGQYVPTQANNQSISTLVERSAVSSGIRGDISKINADKKQNIKVDFKSVEFDRVVQWLGKLQNDYGITPKNVSINRTDSAGMVSCRVTLEKASL